MDSCKTEETATGKEGEEDSSLYHVRTKSLTIMIIMSLRVADIIGDSGYKGGKDCGEFWDHCDLVTTACHAAGVENAKGLAAFPTKFRARDLLESRKWPRKTWSAKKASPRSNKTNGDMRRRVRGEETIR